MRDGAIMMATALARRCKLHFTALWHDCRGIVATEFAIVVPIMLIAFFGTVEFCSAVAVDRKIGIMARTLSDLTSQNASVTDAQLTNIFNASTQIMTPYTTTPLQSTISELYVDPNTLVARVQWSQGVNTRATGSTVAIPTALKIAGTYLIYSEVKYQYVPTVGYVMAKAGIALSDFSYTRPRQSVCVMYNTSVCPTS
jgi:Flp pilus assembly protein TadG